MNRAAVAIGLLSLSLFSASAFSQEAEPAAEDPAHEELRELRRGLTRAVEQADIEGMLEYLHPDVVVTFMDATQCRGRDEVRAYFERMLEGEDRVVESYRIDAEVKELTTLYGGDAGISYGTATTYFNLTDGREFTVTGPWSATTVRQDGRWLIGAFHSSASLFDNPILTMLRQWIVWAAVIAGGLGLLLGVGLMAVVRRRRPARGAASEPEGGRA